MGLVLFLLHLKLRYRIGDQDLRALAEQGLACRLVELSSSRAVRPAFPSPSLQAIMLVQALGVQFIVMPVTATPSIAVSSIIPRPWCVGFIATYARLISLHSHLSGLVLPVVCAAHDQQVGHANVVIVMCRDVWAMHAFREVHFIRTTAYQTMSGTVC